MSIKSKLWIILSIIVLVVGGMSFTSYYQGKYFCYVLSKFFDLNSLNNKILHDLTSQKEIDQETIEKFRELTEYLNLVLSDKGDDLNVYKK